MWAQNVWGRLVANVEYEGGVTQVGAYGTIAVEGNGALDASSGDTEQRVGSDEGGDGKAVVNTEGCIGA